MSNLQVKIVLCGGTMPAKSTGGSAAYDVCAARDYILTNGRNKVPLGFKMSFSPDWELLIDARSGFSVKGFEAYHVADIKFERPKRIDADVIQGKGDSDYRGEYNVIVKSNESEPYVIKAGTRIAQITFVPVGSADFDIVEDLDKTDRGDGGFGSTGTKIKCCKNCKFFENGGCTVRGIRGNGAILFRKDGFDVWGLIMPMMIEL